MKDVYLIKRITYMLDEDDILENVNNKEETDVSMLLNPNNFNLMSAIVWASSNMEIIGIVTSSSKAKNMMRKLCEGDNNTQFTTNGNIIHCSGTILNYLPEEHRTDDNDTILYATMYQAVKVPIDKLFNEECSDTVNFENFHMLAEAIYDLDNLDLEDMSDEIVDANNSVDLTSLDFGAFFNNGNKNIPS